MKRILPFLLILALAASLSLGLGGCSQGPPASPSVPQAGDAIEAGDYSKKTNWMLLPPEDGSEKKPIDIFYLYPTSWGISNPTDYPVCPLDLRTMRSTARSNAEKQATAFAPVGNLYAPYYRQLAVAFVLNLPKEDRAAYFGGIPAADAAAAFDYYIEHYNEGRPFILVGHSQGAAVLKELLFTYMKDHPQVYSRMVAAYVIGYSVTAEELEAHPWLRFAEGPQDTGVIVSYNTEAPGYTGENQTMLPGAIAINPISWTRGTAVAPASQNPGSYVKVDGKMTPVPELADAQVNPDRGTVLCSTITPEEFHSKNTAFFPPGVYHSFDIALYYFSLRQNAQLRSDSWFLQVSSAPNP